VLVQTKLPVAFLDLSKSGLSHTDLEKSLTFKCIAGVKVYGSFMIDSQVWGAVRRRKCIRGWDPKVDHR